jgi:hypothetical protein
MVMIRHHAGTVLVCVTLCCCAPGEIVDPARHQAIVSGARSEAGFLPGIGALVVDTSGEQRVFCTATLISKRTLVTAAHCFANIPQGSTVGFFAGLSLDSANASGQVLAVKLHEKHPEFAGGTPPVWFDSGYNDIAVAKLAQPAPVEPVRIARPGVEVTELVKVGADAVVVGYGQTEPLSKSSSGTKHQGSVTIGEVATDEIYLEGGGPQKCHGDSGGPTLGDLDPGPGRDWRLIGVASRAGESCTGGSIETRVDAHLSWIHEQDDDLPCGSGLGPDCPGRETGEPCGAGWECSGGLCVPLPESDGDQRICSQTCSPDGSPGDCPDSYRCEELTLPTGGHACLPAKSVDTDDNGCTVAIGSSSSGYRYRESALLAPILLLVLFTFTATRRS